MKSLTGLDATFLYLETPEMPMHVGSFNLCALPAGLNGSFHKAVTQHIGKRMHLAPVFSRKLVFMPLDLGHPLWVEADSVDIKFHIRRATLANPSAKKSTAPMTLDEAHKLCAQLHGEVMDRNFPLWQFYVFDRIKLPESMGGNVVGGFFSKIHHAALDGKGGVMLANALLDLTPAPRDVPKPDLSKRRIRQADLKIGKMIGSVFSSSLGQLMKAAKLLPSAAASLSSALTSTLTSTLTSQAANASLKGAGAKMPMRLAPATSFNAGISAERVFVTATVPLAECKTMGKAVGASFNDVVLWICSTALRNYMLQHHSLPAKSLVAAMPVSLRNAGAADAAQLGNQVTMTLVELGTHLAHPLKRMNAIMASTAKVKNSMKSFKGLLPTDYPSLLAPWLVGGAAKMALNAYGKSGVSSKLPIVANLVISNVPGAPVPLFLAGAQVLSFHPLSIIMHGLALNITIQTYAGQVDFGIVADKKALPHANDLARAIEAAFAEAQALLGAPSGAVTAATSASAKSAKLEDSLSRKASPPRDTAAKLNRATQKYASNHGKPITKKIATTKRQQPTKA